MEGIGIFKLFYNEEEMIILFQIIVINWNAIENIVKESAECEQKRLYI